MLYMYLRSGVEEQSQEERDDGRVDSNGTEKREREREGIAGMERKGKDEMEEKESERGNVTGKIWEN